MSPEIHNYPSAIFLINSFMNRMIVKVVENLREAAHSQEVNESKLKKSNQATQQSSYVDFKNRL